MTGGGGASTAKKRRKNTFSCSSLHSGVVESAGVWLNDSMTLKRREFMIKDREYHPATPALPKP